MLTTVIPSIDAGAIETGCCPRFEPVPWDGQELHLDNQPFVKASTISMFHIPLNIGSVFARTWKSIREAGADRGGYLVLSKDDSAWRAEHFFAVSREVPGAEMVRLSGTFLTKVFEGPFRDAPKWCAAMKSYVQEKGRQLEESYFFYTTCPRCAKHYGRNYVVGVARVK
jgi:hypothetical protein